MGQGPVKFEPTFTIVKPHSAPPDLPVIPTGMLIDRPGHRSVLTLPTDKQPRVFTKPNSGEIIRDVKNNLLKSTTLDQIISNIATRHKYKKPESYVAHIEDLLLLYAKD